MLGNIHDRTKTLLLQFTDQIANSRLIEETNLFTSLIEANFQSGKHSNEIRCLNKQIKKEKFCEVIRLNLGTP